MITSKPSTALPSITREEEVGLFTIINQIRVLQGWSMSPAAELEPMCRVWWEEFQRYGIKAEHYQDLYRRAHKARINALSMGVKVPPLDATYLISQWIGENGLRAELHRKDIESGRLLTETAVSDCDLCHGSGYEITGRGAKICGHK